MMRWPMFYENQVLNGTYQIMKPIGSGGTSSVYLAYHLRLMKYVVVKQLRGVQFTDPRVRTEVDILKNLRHSNLPQVYDFFEEQGAVYTVIDFVNGYDLESYIRSGTRFTQAQLKRYLHQIAQALAYMHSKNPAVIHSDIKPGNIIIDQNGDAILIDFNTSLGANRGNLLGLTLPYASPEQIQMARCISAGYQPDLILDPRSDLYSLGATFYELITGIRPMAGTVPAPLRSMGLTQYSDSFLMLIDSLMVTDREKRIPSAKKLITAIERLEGSYWTMFALRCVSLIMSAAIFSTGVYCLIHGTQQETAERFQHTYQSIVRYIFQGDLELADRSCDAVFADGQLQQYLQQEPEALAQMYHAIGDVEYYSGNYAAAAANYYYAISCSQQLDDTLKAVYNRDAAVAYAQAGETANAKLFLEAARAANATANDLLLIEVVLASQSGDEKACLDAAQQLCNQCTDPQICLRGALSASSVAKSTDDRIRWLEKAKSYGGGKTAQRSLAVAYAERYRETAQKTDLENAITLYRELCNSEYASLEDMLNYATVLRMDDRLQDAAKVLKSGLNTYPNHYRLLMDLCFIYHSLGDATQTSVYCDQALRAWKADVSEGKLSEASEQVQNLLEIARRYGIGGLV